MAREEEKKKLIPHLGDAEHVESPTPTTSYTVAAARAARHHQTSRIMVMRKKKGLRFTDSLGPQAETAIAHRPTTATSSENVQTERKLERQPWMEFSLPCACSCDHFHGDQASRKTERSSARFHFARHLARGRGST
nr:unnamed protein product [Digitaria exilis]